MSNIVKWNPNLAVSRRIEEALELVNQKAPAVRRVEQSRPLWGSNLLAPQTATALPQVVAMPRVCTIVGNPYAAYYPLSPDGAYRYSRSGQLNKASLRELFSGVGVSKYRMRSEDIDEENCPWCGASGQGAVHCTRCDAFTCWGSVVDNRFWRCRPSCGFSSELVRRAVEHIGIIPRAGI